MEINHDEILDIMLEHKLSKDEAIEFIKNRHIKANEEKYYHLFNPQFVIENLTESEVVTMVNFVFTYENHFIHEQKTIDKYEELYKQTILEYLADYTRDHFENCDDMEEAFLVEYNPNNLVCYIDTRIKMKDEDTKD